MKRLKFIPVLDYNLEFQKESPRIGHLSEGSNNHISSLAIFPLFYIMEYSGMIPNHKKILHIDDKGWA